MKWLTSPGSVDCKPVDREKIYSENAIDFYDEPHNQLAKLSWFLHGALGHNTDVHPGHLPIDYSQRWPFEPNQCRHRCRLVYCGTREHPFGMDIRLWFADNNDQVLCLLNLVWRID